MTAYADLASLKENDRIEVIGQSVMNQPTSSADQPLMAAFLVEDDVKADRYIRKLEKRFPGIRVIARGPGPIPGSITVKIGPPLR